ncbi:MAG: PEGA domain-containing protein, partial [Vicinamibacterales bacterium]
MTLPLFEDGFGRRVLALDPDGGEPIERLSFSPALAQVDEFAPALGDLVSRYASARHASYLRVRRVDRPDAGELVMVSDRVAGWRLSEVLRVSAREHLKVDLSAVINVLRQLLPAVTLFSRHQKDLGIGNVAPERLLITPQGRLVIVEHLLGAALESLHYSRERYWRDLRVALPPAPRISPRADATGIGLVALSLVLGRTLDEDEYPERLTELIESASETIDGTSRPLSAGFRSWLSRSLQIDVRTAFQSPREAQVAFEAVLASDRAYVTSSPALEEWLRRYAALAGSPAALVFTATEDSPAPPSPGSTREPTLSGSRSPAITPVVLEVPESALPASPTATGFDEAPAERNSTKIVSAVPRPSRVVAVLAAVAILEATAIGWLWLRDPAPPLSTEGELVVQTRPQSARVSIDGEERGVTPLTVGLSPGTHVLEIRVGRSEPRVIPLTIRAGVQSSQYIELQSVPTTGGLEVRSEPTRASVTVDGRARGSTPLTLRDLPPGDHEVTLQT